MKKYAGFLIGSLLMTTVAQATYSSYSSGCGPARLGSIWPTTQAQWDFGFSTSDMMNMLGRGGGCGPVVHLNSSTQSSDSDSQQDSEWTASDVYHYVKQANRLNPRGKTFILNTDSGTKFFPQNMTTCGKLNFANGTRLYYLKTIVYKFRSEGTDYVEPIFEFYVPAGTRVLSRKNINGVIKNGVLLKTCSLADFADKTDDYQGLRTP
jgi:hypothetical protein